PLVQRSEDERRPMTDDSSKAKLRRAAPVFLVGDIASTMRWYQTNLGFHADPFPESAPHAFCILSRNDVEIMLQLRAGYQKPDRYNDREDGVWSVYLRMEGVRALFLALSERHAVRVLEPIHRQPYGETEFIIEDPNGYTLVFAERE
ncbi:MAG: VOC family protein, partial [Vicinamibacterales bacterium]